MKKYNYDLKLDDIRLRELNGAISIKRMAKQIK